MSHPRSVGTLTGMELVVDEDLRLVSLEESDAKHLFALVDDNRDYLRVWLPWLDGNRKWEDSLSFIRDQRSSASREENIAFAIRLCGNLCGVADYSWIDDINSACGLGYWISEDEQGQGIVNRCCRALIDHAFSELGLARVEIHAAEGNAKSRAVAERLGFHTTDVRKDAEWLYDHFVNHVVYTLPRGPYTS